MIFCLDTSAWLDGWVRDYPEEVFPSLWEKLEECIASGRVRCSEEVYVELEKKDDGIHDWLKKHKQVVVPINEEIQRIVAELLAEHPRLVDTFRQRSQADPFVIATAEALGAVVVTGEKPRGKLDIPKIPDVCEQRKIPCISFLQMLRELEWKF
jgi:predicted nucleic acid-binding protein